MMLKVMALLGEWRVVMVCLVFVVIVMGPELGWHLMKSFILGSVVVVSMWAVVWESFEVGWCCMRVSHTWKHLS